MRLHRLILVGFVTAAALIMITGASGLALMWFVESEHEAILDGPIPRLDAIETLRNASTIAALAFESGAPANSAADVRSAVEDLDRVVGRNENEQRLLDLATEQAIAFLIAGENLARPVSTESDTQIDGNQVTFQETELAFLETIEEASRLERSEISAASARVETTIEVASVAIGCVMLGAVVGIVIVGHHVRRNVRRPLAALASTSERLRAGDLTARIVEDGPQDVVEVAHSFNVMAAELEESRDRAVRAERLRALGTLVAGVAHEVNNPLTFVRGNTELTGMAIEDALADPSLPTALRESLAEALTLQTVTLSGIDRIAHITKSLKAVARSTSVERGSCGPNAILESALAVAAGQISHDVDVECSFGSTQRVDVNPEQLSQVALNLILNASEAMAATGGHLKIRTRDEDDQVILEVEDSGPGIPDEVQARIFTPFFTTKSSGTGLGLSISHRIAEDHGGALTFDSTLGRGTTFRLSLPRAAPLMTPISFAAPQATT